MLPSPDDLRIEIRRFESTASWSPALNPDFTDPVTGFAWIPMLAFEVSPALWLLIKGVAAPTGR